MLIGRFEVTGSLGEGGMGKVYEARDPRLDRQVAIKLIHEAGTQGALRLLREAQAMARLQHPNVVAIHEVGQHEGQVYIAMERVDGVSLDRLDPPPAGWREIVALFVQAGRGLAAAHAQGLIHRDIKPHNLLVGRDGRVQVGDFGLARLADGLVGGDVAAPSPRAANAVDDVTADEPGAQVSATAVTVEEHGPPSPAEGRAAGALGAGLTGPAAQPGTPRYMAPEQHARRPATAASDQFAFCVTLWETLFGEHPFVRKADEAWADAIAAGRRRPAPRGTAPGWLIAALERGLARDPRARWPSMTALVAALDHRPRRRRVAFVAAAAAALAAGAAVTGYALTRAPAARPDVCAAAGAGFDAVWSPARREAITRGFTAARPFGADTAGRVAARLDDYGARWSAARVDACRATHGPGATGQPAALLDRRMQCLDRALSEVGLVLDKLAAATPAVVDGAVDKVGRLPGLDGCGPDLARVMADPDDPRAAAIRRDYDVMRVTYNRGDVPAAVALAPDLKRRADELGHPTIRAFIYINAALFAAGTLPDEQVAAELEQGHADAVRAGDVGLEARAVAYMLSMANRAGDRARIETLLPLATATLGRPGITTNARVTILYNQADALRVLGQFDEALAACDRLAAAEDDPDTDAPDCRCNTLMEAARIAEAATACRAAADANAAVYGPEHPYVYSSLGSLSAVEMQRGNYAEALALRQRVVPIYERDFGPESVEVITIRENLASTLSSLQRYDEARAIYADTIAIRRRTETAPSSGTALALLGLAEVELGSGDRARGLQTIDEAAAMHARTAGVDHPEHLAVLAFRAELYYAAGRWAVAEEGYRRCAEGAPAAFGEGSMMHGACLGARAATLVELGRHREALPLARRSLAILATVEADPAHVATAHMALGRAQAKLGDRAAGIASLEAAIAAFRSAGEPLSDDLPRAEKALAALRR